MAIKRDEKQIRLIVFGAFLACASIGCSNSEFQNEMQGDRLDSFAAAESFDQASSDIGYVQERESLAKRRARVKRAEYAAAAAAASTSSSSTAVGSVPVAGSGSSTATGSVPVAGSGSSTATGSVPVDSSSGSTSGYVPVSSQNDIAKAIVALGSSLYSYPTADVCVDVQETKANFVLANDVNGRPAIQMTALPFDKYGISFEAYDVWAIYKKEDGTVYAEGQYSESTLNGERLYGHFNCIQQFNRVEDRAVEIGLSLENIAPKVGVILREKTTDNLIGVAIRSQSENKVTVRCKK